MKLDVNVLRHLERNDFRVLTAVEMGQKNHEIVPAELITSIAKIKHGGTYKHLSVLLRHKLLHHDGAKYDGFRLTTMGYDFLAINTLVKRGAITGVGRQIGVGKESDVFEVTNEDGEVLVLKLHRLGRTSFRAVKSKRDYLGTRNSYSWLYLSRLSALKEFAFMRALGEHGLPVPVAIEQNRHAVLMSLVPGYPLVQVRELANPGAVYARIMGIMARLAQLGLVHCDFNEFNLLVDDDDNVTLIDFPQMVSVTHGNAAELFERDVDCIVRFFKKKLGYIPEQDAGLLYLRPSFEDNTATAGSAVDVELEASGFKRKHQEQLERFIQSAGDGEGSGEGDADELTAVRGDADDSSVSDIASELEDEAEDPHSPDDLRIVELGDDKEAEPEHSDRIASHAAAGGSETGGKLPSSVFVWAEAQAAAVGSQLPLESHSWQQRCAASPPQQPHTPAATLCKDTDNSADDASGDEADAHRPREDELQRVEAGSRQQGFAASCAQDTRSIASTATSTQAQDVQQRVLAARRQQVQQRVKRGASRNATKLASNKTRREAKAAVAEYQ